MAIESERAFLSVIKYIHDNPVEANICRFPSEYRWSSFNAYYGAKNPVLNVSKAYNVAGSKESLLRYFAKENVSTESFLSENDQQNVNHFLTDEKALEIFKSLTLLASTSDVASLGKPQRNNYVRALRTKGLTIKQIARLMDISATTVKRICKVVH